MARSKRGARASARGRPRLVTDEQIFRALSETITAKGPHRWTLSDVADRLGLTGPALGHRFGSKHGLLVAFASAQPSATANHFDAVRATTSTPREAIIDALVGLTGSMRNRRDVANNVGMLSLDIADDELEEYARRQAQIITSKLASLVQACVGPDGTDAQAAAEHIHIVWTGAIIAWAIAGEGELSEWIARKIDAGLYHLGI